MPGADATWSLLAGQAPCPLNRPPQTPKPVQRDLDTHSSHRSKMPEASCFAETARRPSILSPSVSCKLPAAACQRRGADVGPPCPHWHGEAGPTMLALAFSKSQLQGANTRWQRCQACAPSPDVQQSGAPCLGSVEMQNGKKGYSGFLKCFHFAVHFLKCSRVLFKNWKKNTIT